MSCQLTNIMTVMTFKTSRDIADLSDISDFRVNKKVSTLQKRAVSIAFCFPHISTWDFRANITCMCLLNDGIDYAGSGMVYLLNCPHNVACSRKPKTNTSMRIEGASLCASVTDITVVRDGTNVAPEWHESTNPAARPISAHQGISRPSGQAKILARAWPR